MLGWRSSYVWYFKIFIVMLKVRIGGFKFRFIKGIYLSGFILDVYLIDLF